MKTVARADSRREIARRGRQVADRHAQAGHWGAQTSPMFTTGRVDVQVAGPGEVTAHGGIAALHQLVTRLGLAERINERLNLLKVHLPYSESDHVLNLAYNVAAGHRRLGDIELLRHDVPYMNALGADLIPDPTTAGDFCRRFDQDAVTELMEAINAVRPQLWDTRAKDLLGPVAFIDVDGTDAPTDGCRKQGVDISYKGVWGYAPLIVSLANTREVLYVVNREGNQPSHAGAAAWIDRAIDLVAPHAPRVCLRGDTDFSLTGNFDRWAQRVDFVFGMDCSAALRTRAEALPESAWHRLDRTAGKPAPATERARRDNHKQAIVTKRGYLNLELNHEDLAEFDYRPGKCARPYRVIALRKNITRARGEQALIDEIRYFFYITTRTDLSRAQVVALANQRCDQENIHEQLKNGVNAMRVPLYDLVSNWAYMVACALAWNLKSWFALMMHRKSDRRTWIGVDYPTFLHAMIRIPARVIRHARTTTIRLLGYTPHLDRLYSAWNTIHRTSFG